MVLVSVVTVLAGVITWYPDGVSPIHADYGSASLFRRACKVAHWCLLTWESSVHTSLAALELLQGLAQLQFEYIGELRGRTMSDKRKTV